MADTIADVEPNAEADPTRHVELDGSEAARGRVVRNLTVLATVAVLVTLVLAVYLAGQHYVIRLGAWPH